MLQRFIEYDLVVRATQRPRKTSTCRRQRLEAQLFQSTRGSHVPGVRHHETTGGVQVTKRGYPIVLYGHATPLQEAGRVSFTL
jgi:hypothetical protein